MDQDLGPTVEMTNLAGSRKPQLIFASPSLHLRNCHDHQRCYHHHHQQCHPHYHHHQQCHPHHHHQEPIIIKNDDSPVQGLVLCQKKRASCSVDSTVHTPTSCCCILVIVLLLLYYC